MIRQVMVLSLAILTWTEAVAQSPTPIPSSSTTPALSSLPGYSSTAVADGYLAARKPLRDALGMETEGTEGERSDEIETDRDSFTPATATVGRETLVLEAAYSFLDNLYGIFGSGNSKRGRRSKSASNHLLSARALFSGISEL